jgi:DNA-binding transcriptional LysR family regulator
LICSKTDARLVRNGKPNTVQPGRRQPPKGRAGTLRIGFGVAVAEILQRTILGFRKSYPDVELQMRDMSTPSQIAALLDASLDVGILRMPIAHPELISIPLFR